jgi:hypothetical protein
MDISILENTSDVISRQAAIDALWKALYDYEDKTEKQFQESDELDVADWFLHRIFVQNMSDIDRKTILNLPSAQPTITHEQAIDYLHETGWLQNHDRILTEHEQMYKKAFSVACELLIGANLFGTTEETMFKEIMDKDGIVSSLGYERYILENLLRLTGEDDGTD